MLSAACILQFSLCAMNNESMAENSKESSDVQAKSAALDSESLESLVQVMTFAAMPPSRHFTSEEICDQEICLDSLKSQLQLAQEKWADENLTAAERASLKEEINTLREQAKYAQQDLDDMLGKPIALSEEFLTKFLEVTAKKKA